MNVLSHLDFQLHVKKFSIFWRILSVWASRIYVYVLQVDQRLTSGPFLSPSHHSTCPSTTKADKNKISLITSKVSFTQTAECEDGGQRTSKGLLIRSRQKQMECE